MIWTSELHRTSSTVADRSSVSIFGAAWPLALGCPPLLLLCPPRSLARRGRHCLRYLHRSPNVAVRYQRLSDWVSIDIPHQIGWGCCTPEIKNQSAKGAEDVSVLCEEAMDGIGTCPIRSVGCSDANAKRCATASSQRKCSVCERHAVQISVEQSACWCPA